jgi:hypothetical protein
MILCTKDKEAEGKDHDSSGDGLFGTSKIVNVEKIDKIMTATLGLVDNVGINLLAFLAPGFEEAPPRSGPLAL